MRIDPPRVAPAIFAGGLLAFSLSLPLTGQDPTGRERGRRGERPKPVVLKVGTVHPVSGPAFANGVIVIAGSRIQAVGKAGEVAIPEDAETIEYPDGHAYPGLVDALSGAFADEEAAHDRAANAGSAIRAGLDGTHEESQRLIAAGITTAYVQNRSDDVAWRGQGAIVRPRGEGFGTLPANAAPHADAAAVALRMTTGAAPGSPLDRVKALTALGDAFEGLETYEKTFTEHEKAAKEYEKQLDEWLGQQRRRNGRPERAEGAAGERAAAAGSQPQSQAQSQPQSQPTSQPASQPQTPPAGGPGGESPFPRGNRGRRGGIPGGGEPGGGPSNPGPQPASQPAGATTQPSTAPAASQPGGRGAADPKRPTFPKAPPRDPAKDALLRVKKGTVPLRIEAHRREELAAALALQRTRELPRVVLEGATEAAAIGSDLVTAGIPVVVTPQPAPADAPPPFDTADGSLAGKLAQAGVSVAIASGNARDGRFLPLLAAFAAGKGMDEEAAVRAITLTPAEILGLGKLVGSLQPGKLADVVITTEPLLRSDARVLRVVAGGRTEYESR